MKTFLSIISTIALSISAYAADKKEALTGNLSDYKLGRLITGPAVDLSAAAGKAVVIEKWGVNCGPCIASLPHMERLAKTNRNDTIVIGAHSQQATDDEIKAVVKKNKLSYAIVEGLQGPSSGNTIPHALVFDTTGALIYSGNPLDRDFASAVRKAGRPPVKK